MAGVLTNPCFSAKPLTFRRIETMTSCRPVALISPPSRAFNHHRPPLALMYLSGHLKKHGIACRIVDLPQTGQIRNRKFYDSLESRLSEVQRLTVERLRGLNPDIVGITCYTPELTEVRQLARAVRVALPDAKIVVGGVHPTLFPEQIADGSGDFDVAVVGEGEETLLDLVRCLRAPDGELARVFGIAYRDHVGNRCVITPVRPVAEKLDDVIAPDYDDLDMAYYTTAAPYCVRGVFLRGFYVLASRGCPSSCTFCVSKRLRDHQGPRHFTRLRDPAKLAAEILDLRARFGIDGFYFIDDLFTLRREVVREFCDRLRQARAPLIWGCSSKVNTVDEGMLREMRDAGCVQIDFGVEKGSDDALKSLKKGITVAQIERTFGWCRTLGIRTFANILINTPGETERDLEDVSALLDRLNATVVSINTFTPYPGCEIYDSGCPPFAPADYPLLMQDPNRLATERPGQFRFAAHQTDLALWSRMAMQRYNRFTPNVSFFFDRRYIRTLWHSRRKRDYLRQAGNLAREFINQM